MRLQTVSLASEDDPAALPARNAPPHLGHRFLGRQHRLAQIALTGRRCAHPVQIGERGIERVVGRRIVDDVVRPRCCDPGLFVRPAVARIDEAQVVETEVGAGAGHHAYVVRQLRLDEDHRRCRAGRRNGAAANVRPADPVPQLAQHPPRPKPVVFARPRLFQCRQPRGGQPPRSRALQADGPISDHDLLVPRDEIVERGDTQRVRAALATRTGHLIGFAAQFRAVGEHRLQRFPVEPRQGQGAQTGIHGLLVAGMHDEAERRSGVARFAVTNFDLHPALSVHLSPPPLRTAYSERRGQRQRPSRCRPWWPGCVPATLGWGHRAPYGAAH